MKKTIIALLLVACCITTCFVGGTFAKYTTTISGSDTAIVAKFAVSALGVDDADSVTETATIDIFKQSEVWDTEGVTDFTVDGTEDADVDDGATAIIAPGTWGKFEYTISNDSEVTVNYAINYTIDEAGVPLKWSLDGVAWTDTLANVPATVIDDTTVNVTIYWKWDYAGDDGVDTGLGFAGNAEPSVEIAVTFTQVD